MTRRVPISPSPDAALLKLVDGYLAANTKWRAMNKAECRAPWSAVRAMESKSGAVLRVLNRLLVKVERKRAFTLAGIVGKARVAAIEGADDEDFAATLGVSMARDLLALGAKPPAVRKRRKAA